MLGHWSYDMHDGTGWGWWIPLVVMVLLVSVGLIGFGVALMRRSGSGDQRATNAPPGPIPPTPQQILAERLARGEIEPDDYHRRLEALSGPRP